MQAGQISGSKAGITAAVMCAALMAVIDISIVNVALSDIRASFGTPLDQIAWVSTGYMMANVIVIPLTGWLQRRFGFRKYYTASILMFVTASALCGVAWNLPSLVVFRILQGCGGGAIIPTSQAILFSRYPKEEHGMAGALFGIGAMCGPLLGPTLGGYLIDIWNWHWIFLINVPVGLGAAFLAWRYVEEPGYKKVDVKVDRFGLGLLIVGMASLQYVLEEGNRNDWFEDPSILVCSILAFIALTTFIVHEMETPEPIVDLRVFSNRSYTAATGVNFLLGTALFAGSFMLSLYLGTIMHYSALDIDVLFLKGSFIQLALMPLIGKFGGKLDARLMIGFGVLMNCLSLWLNGHLTNQSSEWLLIQPLLVRSIGMCFIFVPLSVVALSDLAPNKRGSATGLFNLTRELGGSIGTAWMSTMLNHRTASAYEYLSENVSKLNPIAREQLQSTQQGMGWKFTDPEAGALSILKMRISGQALIQAFNYSYVVLVMVFILSIGLVLLFKKPQPGVKVEGAH